MNAPNDINDTSLIPLTPSIPPHSKSNGFSTTPLGSFGVGASGMWQVMAAVLDNITAIQNYNSEGLMPLSTTIEGINESDSEYWLNIMTNPAPKNPYQPSKDTPPTLGQQGNSDQYDIQSIIAFIHAGGDATVASTLMQEATTTFNTHNTLYSQANTFWSGINNGLNQSSSDTSQTIQVDLQLYSQGPGTQMQTLAQVI